MTIQYSNITRICLTVLSVTVLCGFQLDRLIAGHEDLQVWLLATSDEVPDTPGNSAKVELGKKLFFDPRLSRDGSISCASCHNPALGWSNGLPTSVGFKGNVLRRAAPTIINSRFNKLHNWDGSARSLEQQALGPLISPAELNADLPLVTEWLQQTPGYADLFQLAFPTRAIGPDTITEAIAAFEKTIVSNNTPFDQWIKGEHNAMTEQQVRGFRVFMDKDKGNCEICHSAPNFTDNSFHNIGLKSFSQPDADNGRYELIPVEVLKGAFKTPSLRDVTLTAPYFHDGSAATLSDVVEHYVRGGDVQDNLSPDISPLDLTDSEKADLISFLHALESPPSVFITPQLPHSGRIPHDNTKPKSLDESQIMVNIDE